MARKDTFTNLDEEDTVLSRFDNFKLEQESEEIETPTLPKEEVNEKEVLSEDNPEIDVTHEYDNKNKFFKRSGTIQRSWRAYPEIDQAINDIFKSKDGKLLPGARGEITKLMNNALLEELVRIGYFDKSKLREKMEYDGW